MSLICEPKGKAREYSPLALNIYSGCDHDCSYCYVKTFPYATASTTPIPKRDIVKNLETELSKTEITKQVLLSFTGDPYCKAETELGITRQLLQILSKHNVPAAILTKGGTRILRDLNILKSFRSFKSGSTLTFNNDKDSLTWEPGAALPENRLESLRELHGAGIKTWVSFEPVIIPEQSLNLIEKTLSFVDQYKLGKWNHDPRSDKIDWAGYARKSVDILRANGKQFYVKEDLRKYINELSPQESDMDFMSLTANESQGRLF